MEVTADFSQRLKDGRSTRFNVPGGAIACNGTHPLGGGWVQVVSPLAGRNAFIREEDIAARLGPQQLWRSCDTPDLGVAPTLNGAPYSLSLLFDPVCSP